MIETLPAERYARAERYLPWNLTRLYRNAEVRPHWSEGVNRFWYQRQERGGAKSFVLIDAERAERRAAFDHARLASALERAVGETIDAERLPFEWIRLEHGAVHFHALGRAWRFHPADAICRAEPGLPPLEEGELPSPDRRWAVSRRGEDLWLRPLRGGSPRPLTRDGEADHGWGKLPDTNLEVVIQRRSGRSPLPVVAWSPDSRRLLTHRLDERSVAPTHLLQSVPDDGAHRPALHTYRYPMAGDDGQPTAALAVFDVDGLDPVMAEHPPLLVAADSPIEKGLAFWDASGERVWFIDVERGSRALRLCVMDALSGNVAPVLEERGSTYVDYHPDGWADPLVRILRGGEEILWFSERDGWGHLYLFDRAGRLLRQVTRGAWTVRDLLRVDEERRQLLFVAGGREPGRDPYYRHVYSVGLDGGEPELLTPEDAEHQVCVPGRRRFTTHDGPPDFVAPQAQGCAPSGAFFVDTFSRIDTPPVSVLRDASGRLVMTLEETDVEALEAAGWRWPERFTVKAADGTTDLFGALFLPSDLGTTQKIPVIDSIYPGPQTIRTPKASLAGSAMGVARIAYFQALAELGFAVLVVDGRGGPYRSKAFHDVSYGHLERAGTLEDHVAALRQLGARLPCLDLDRVGMSGFSGGGTATVRALCDYPEVYRVGVAAAGSHDLRGYLAFWGEKYQGLPGEADYERASNYARAAGLRGKLLLVCGELDENCHPAMTFRLVHALQQANQDCDLLVLTNQSHLSPGRDGYYLRRSWDYMVRHLMGKEPPPGYSIVTPSRSDAAAVEPPPAAGAATAAAGAGVSPPTGRASADRPGAIAPGAE